MLYAASSASLGIGITFTEPRSAKTYRPSCPLVLPVPAPTPNRVPTAIAESLLLTSTLLGNHPVGISPRSVASAPPLELTVYSATAFTPPSVTNNVDPFGDRATAVGVRPIFRSRNGASVMVPISAFVRVSITLTLSLLPFTT